MKVHGILIMAEEFYWATQLKFAKTPSAGMLFFCPSDHTVFLTHRSPEMSSPSTWDIPGGRPEDEDGSPLETATREVYEEIGSVPKNKKPIGQHVIKTDEHHYIVFIYLFTAEDKKELLEKIQFSDENDQFNWFDVDNLPTKVHFDISWISGKLKNLSQER